MIRNLIRFLVLLFVVAVVRYFIATISQMVSKAVNAGGRPAAPSGGSHGELKRDPVCGTFVAAESSITRTVNGELLHFCSVACRDKFRAA
jgi:YHS domain-containing protein